MEESYTGRVIESTGSWYQVARENNHREITSCRLPGRFRQKERSTTNPISVGDHVTFTLNQDGSGSIQEIHERENYVIRESTNARQGEQILASNVDRAYVVQSIKKPRPKHGFLDRFLVTCEAYRVAAGIVFNKSDLAGENDRGHLKELRELYAELDYPVFVTSIKDPGSLAPLREQLKESVSVFIGPSGVGKSSIVNALDPTIDRKVGEISTYNEKGRHTTTFAKLLPLEFGGYLVDTPGIREFGLVNIEPWELSLYFPEMRPGRENCKFNNCTHSHEPGCGVMEAFEEGEIHPDRYDSYLNILESLQEE